MKKKFLSITNKSLGDFGTPSYKSLWELAQKSGYTGLAVSMKAAFEKKANETDTFHVTVSTDSEDRHGDIVRQKPDLRAFKKNPVVLDSHNYDGIEHIIGNMPAIKAHEEDGFTDGDIRFFTDNPKGDLARRGVEQGFINAVSIGFIPKVFSDKGEILEWELLEVSLVSVPAQAEALFGEKEYQETDGVRMRGRKTNDANEEEVTCMRCEAVLLLADAVEAKTEVEGIVELICPACKAKEPKPKAEGDACEMPDGTPGEMHPNADGEMVCMLPKEKTIAPVLPAKKTARDIIADMAKRDKAALKMIAKAVDNLRKEDHTRSRRHLLQAIRRSINETE